MTHQSLILVISLWFSESSRLFWWFISHVTYLSLQRYLRYLRVTWCQVRWHVRILILSLSFLRRSSDRCLLVAFVEISVLFSVTLFQSFLMRLNRISLMIIDHDFFRIFKVVCWILCWVEWVALSAYLVL
jgi:hypothetical protein